MTSVISTDNYTKTSCLQVFLYTNSQRLYRDAVKELAQGTHNTPVYALCPCFEHKQALTQAMYETLGYTNFSFIGTLEEGLLQVLKYECLNQEALLHDASSVCMAIYQLLIEKDLSLEFLKINPEVSQDHDSLFAIAQSVSEELISLLQLKPGSSDPKLETLLEAIRRLNPKTLFLHEAFALCAPYFHKMRWIGFTTIPDYFLDHLSKSDTVLYIQVPSLAFLGDINSAKQKLKELRNHKMQLDAQFVFNEHPLLESLSSYEKAFYKKLGQLDHVFIDHIEDEGSNNSLKTLQRSLKDGLVESIKFDESLACLKVKSLYQEALSLCGILQKLFEKDGTLTQDDILIVADQKIYGPLLNAIGQSMHEPIYFSDPKHVDPFWDLLQMLLSDEACYQDQNYFLKWVHCYLRLHKGLSIEPLCHDVLKLIKNSHFGALSDLGKGSQYLKNLAAAYRRSLFFEIDKQINCYEFNFLNKLDIDDPLKVLALLDELSKLFEFCQNVSIQKLCIKQWLEVISELLTFEAFTHVSSFEVSSYLIQQMSRFHSFVAKVTAKGFFKLIEKKENKLRPGPEIKINQGTQAPCFDAKWIFYLGAPPIKQYSFSYFEKLNLCLDFARHFIHQAKEGFIWIIDHKKEQEGNLKGFLVELYSSIRGEPFSINCLESIPFQVFSKKPFIDQGFAFEEPNDEMTEPYVIDLKKFSKFVSKQEEFIKKYFLKMPHADENLDLDVSQRILKKWYLKQYGSNFSCKISDPFLKCEDGDKLQEVLRSHLVEIKDALSTLEIHPSLEVITNDNTMFHLTGLTQIDAENKLSTKHQQLKLFKNLEMYFQGDS